MAMTAANAEATAAAPQRDVQEAMVSGACTEFFVSNPWLLVTDKLGVETELKWMPKFRPWFSVKGIETPIGRFIVGEENTKE